jgi:hypothetical protein
MNKLGTNPPVFPIRDMDDHPGPMGITLRDYFAAKAMQGMIVGYSEGMDWPFQLDMSRGDDDTELLCGARVAYAIADAMLKEGGK